MISREIKSKRIMLGLTCFFTLAVGISSMVYLRAKNNQWPCRECVVPGEILIGFKPKALPLLVESKLLVGTTGISSIDKINRKYKAYRVDRLFLDLEPDDHVAVAEGLNRIFKVTVPKEVDLRAIIRELKAEPYIEYAEPNYKIKLLGGVEPNDSKFKEQWALNNKRDADIDAPEAWKLEKGNKNVLIAVVDTGVNYEHEDIDYSRVRTDIDKDFVNNDDDAMDDHGHGTYVAGIIAAATNNNTGIAAICWNCSVLPIKIVNADGTGSAESAANGIQYAANKGAHIINMSWAIEAGSGCSETVAKAINYAWTKGSLLIAAAGNDEQKEIIGYPASSPRVIAVGATNDQDKCAAFSNRGEELDLVAPGVNILSLWLGNPKYKRAKGTSAAAAHVSGVAGLILSKVYFSTPKLSAGQVWWILQHSADDLGPPGWDESYGWGRVNASAALTLNPKDEINTFKDKCEGEPPECAAMVALKGEGEFLSSLRIIREGRERILAYSVMGKRWIRLYYRHNDEVTAMLLFEEDLRSEAREILKIYRPIFQILIGEDVGSKPVILTYEHVVSFNTFIEKLANRGSDQLREDIIFELKQWDLSQFIGQEALKVWEQINASAQH